MDVSVLGWSVGLTDCHITDIFQAVSLLSELAAI